MPNLDRMAWKRCLTKIWRYVHDMNLIRAITLMWMLIPSHSTPNQLLLLKYEKFYVSAVQLQTDKSASHPWCILFNNAHRIFPQLKVWFVVRFFVKSFHENYKNSWFHIGKSTTLLPCITYYHKTATRLLPKIAS